MRKRGGRVNEGIEGESGHGGGVSTNSEHSLEMRQPL